MIFLVLVAVLVIEVLSNGRQWVQQDRWWFRLLKYCEQKPYHRQTLWGWGILLFVPLLIVGLLVTLLMPVGHGWLLLPLDILVVLYAFGRGPIKPGLEAFRDAWRREDDVAAEKVLERELHDFHQGLPLIQRMKYQIVWPMFQGFFAVVFWFVLLGPVMALAYRLVVLLSEQVQLPVLRQQARQVRHALDWLPARALVASFALVGHFSAVSRSLLDEALHWHSSAFDVLGRAVLQAADVSQPERGAAGVEQLDSVWALMVRSVALWYLVLAVLLVLW